MSRAAEAGRGWAASRPLAGGVTAGVVAPKADRRYEDALAMAECA